MNAWGHCPSGIHSYDRIFFVSRKAWLPKFDSLVALLRHHFLTSVNGTNTTRKKEQEHWLIRKRNSVSWLTTRRDTLSYTEAPSIMLHCRQLITDVKPDAFWTSCVLNSTVTRQPKLRLVWVDIFLSLVKGRVDLFLCLLQPECQACFDFYWFPSWAKCS